MKWWCFRPLLCTLFRLNWASVIKGPCHVGTFFQILICPLKTGFIAHVFRRLYCTCWACVAVISNDFWADSMASSGRTGLNLCRNASLHSPVITSLLGAWKKKNCIDSYTTQIFISILNSFLVSCWRIMTRVGSSGSFQIRLWATIDCFYIKVTLTV